MNAARLGATVALFSVASACAYRHTPSVPETGVAPAADDAEPMTYVETTSLRAGRRTADRKERSATAIAVSDEIRTSCGMGGRAGAFEPGSAQLRESGEDLLRDVASCLTKGPLAEARVDVVGITDAKTDEDDFQLGRARALAARRHLMHAGVPDEAIDIRVRSEKAAKRGAPRDATIEIRLHR
jgi:outer membrane protein OmpA-like peptidoglycan-associated protein